MDVLTSFFWLCCEFCKYLQYGECSFRNIDEVGVAICMLDTFYQNKLIKG